MFAKIILAIVSIIALFGSTQSQIVYPAAAAYYPAAYEAVYSPYAYGYAAAYPSYYAWGSNKGKVGGQGPAPAPPAAPAQTLTNSQ